MLLGELLDRLPKGQQLNVFYKVDDFRFESVYRGSVAKLRLQRYTGATLSGDWNVVGQVTNCDVKEIIIR